MAREERTEKPTPKHRRRAREKGQVARSPDLSGALVVTGGLLALSLTGPGIVAAGAASFRDMIARIARPGAATSAAGLKGLMGSGLTTFVTAVGPVAGVCVAVAIIGGAAQVGLRPSAHSLKPDFNRINPVNGLKNLFGPQLAFEAVKALAKVGVVGAIAALTLVPAMTTLASTVGITPGALGVMFGRTGAEVAEHAAFAYVLIGFLDYGYKRWRNEKQLKMTKQEVKDETRQYGVSAEVKMAQRRRQMQIARARMMAAVAKADVVITNPTHFAVALLYDGTRTAPEVVGKGQDLIAAQIRRVAEENGVPIVPDPPLARALHSSTEIGQVIPEELYAAVARVLAFVYRMAGRRRLAS